MRILVVTPFYAPDLGPSSPLVTMLAEDLAALGHQIVVLAAVPHFPTGFVPDEYRHFYWQLDNCNGVQVYRVWVPSGNRNKFYHRLLTFFVYQTLSTLIGLRCTYDAIIVTNPALETGLPFAVLSVIRRKASIFCVWDVYPEVGIRLGVFRHKAIISIVKAMEDFCLHQAKMIQVLSPEFRTTLLHRGIPKQKIEHIAPWLDTEFHRPLPRYNEFSSEFKLDDRFVVMYAGNIGLSQGLESVLQAAQILASYPHIHFVFVGDGTHRVHLENWAQQMALVNVSFIPFQPRERLPYVLASADVALIPLKKGIGQDSLPSKSFPVLASGRPILAAVEQESELGQLVQRANAGICIEPENAEQMAAVIYKFSQSPQMCAQMGEQGREYAVRDHSRKAAALKFEKLIHQSINK